jgi:hypothetical protein
MTNNLKIIPSDAVKLVVCCSGYVGSDPTKVLIETLWRTKNDTYFMNDNEGLMFDCDPEDLIHWINLVLHIGDQYYYCCGDTNIHELRKEVMELINVN